MSCDCNKKPYTITHALDLDIDDLSTLPDYFIAMRTVEDPSTGTTIATPVRVPGERVMPTSNLANVVALDINNDALNIPENQVRAGYIDVQPGGNVMRLADNAHPAQFLMLGKYTDNKMLIQTTGFLAINAGHQYLIGRQYYDDGAGVPTTNSSTGRKLFKPVSDTILNVNGDF